MKKKIISLCAVLLMVAGCGSNPKLKNGEEAVVTFKDGENISVNDLYDKMKDSYALTMLTQMIDEYVLETSFPDYVKKAKESSESFISSLKENYDDEDKLLDDIKNYTGMTSIEAYQHYMYINYMQQHATSEYAKTQISDKEMEKYYEDEVVGDIEVSHILITANVKDDMKDADKKKAEDKAKNKAEDVLKELKADNKKDIEKTFKKLAKKYSKDDATKENGGSLGKINKNTLSAQYDELVKAAYSIKDGEYYSDIVTTELGYHIILRTKSYEKASYKKSKADIRTTLANELVANDKTISYYALDHYRKELNMEIKDKDLKTQYAYYMNNVLSNLTKTDEENTESK